MYKIIFLVNTFNRGEIMKKVIIYSIYSFCLVLMIGLVVGYNTMNKSTKEEVSTPVVDYDYVYDLFDNVTEQVNNETEVTLIRPYNEEGIEIKKNYYNYKGDEESQRNSLIYHDGIYMQNTGICYGTDTSFDIITVLDGEVTEVVNDELVGNSITVKHNDNTYSIYQSVTDITVKQGDQVNQGDKLGVSSTSNINKDLNYHLYFEYLLKV